MGAFHFTWFSSFLLHFLPADEWKVNGVNYPSAAFRAAAAGEEMKNEGGRVWRCQLVKTATPRPGPPRRHADGQAQLRPDGSDPTTAGRCQASSECRRGGRRDSQLTSRAAFWWWLDRLEPLPAVVGWRRGYTRIQLFAGCNYIQSRKLMLRRFLNLLWFCDLQFNSSIYGLL